MPVKYRYRTMLRTEAPEAFARLIPKGRKDCGEHEWYRSDGRTWRCYHCLSGVTHEVPWSEREIAARRIEAKAVIRGAQTRRPAPPSAP